MDRDPIAYEMLKAALYDGRVDLPKHDHLERELVSLERDEKTGKVDHLPHGSKDLADALAGVVWGLSTRLEVYYEHDVGPWESPSLLKFLSQSDSERDAAE